MSKMNLLRSLFFAICLLGFNAASFAQGPGSQRVVTASGVLSVDAVKPDSKFKVAIVLEVAGGYHINAHVPSLDSLKATEVTFNPPPGLNISDITYPVPVEQAFEFAPGQPLAVHEGTVIITADATATKKLQGPEATLRASVQVQACNDNLCLAPSDLNVEIPLKLAGSKATVRQINDVVFLKAAVAASDLASQKPRPALRQYDTETKPSDPFAAALSSGGTLSLLGIIFLSGLLLNLTPCVYPIIPITIGFFVNQSASAEGRPRLGRSFALASMYVIGMALTYSLLGVIAARSGGLFGAALQKPVVLIGLATMMVALSLSMFGVYEFRMPEALNRFATRSTQSTSGLVGAVVMGLTMGIVAAPCIGPFVLGLLVHVGTRGDALYGFFLFFVLALGLGLPYLFLGAFSGSLKSLPRSGLWMVTVRKVFGVVLFGMALYFLAPLLGDFSRYAYVAFFSIAAVYLVVWEANRTKPAQFAWVLRGLGLGSAALSLLMVLPRAVEGEIAWQPYTPAALEAARLEKKAVIIDTYADWCIPCKELDRNTFTDPAVRSEADRFVALKLDLTSQDSNTDAGRARERFEILGVPTVIFIDSNGQELKQLRLEGFEKPDAFLSRLKKVPASPAPHAAEPGVAKAEGIGAPDSAPALSLNLLEGGALDISSLKGKVVLIDFWATWCLPCISEIPMFNQLQKDYAAKGLEIVAVSLDEEGAAKVRPFLKEHPMNYTQVIGDSNAASAFTIDESKLPVALLVDKQGRIRFRHVGITPRTTFEREITELLAE